MRYEHLFSPLKINNMLFKNRMAASNSLPHFTQGPEKYPNDAIIEHLAMIAKNGAAFVTFADWSDASVRSFGHGDICHFPVYDLFDPALESCMNQLTDAIHFYGSKVSIALNVKAPMGYGVYDREELAMPEGFEEMFLIASFGISQFIQEAILSLLPYECLYKICDHICFHRNVLTVPAVDRSHEDHRSHIQSADHPETACDQDCTSSTVCRHCFRL